MSLLTFKNSITLLMSSVFFLLSLPNQIQAQELLLFEEFNEPTLNPEVWNVIRGNGCPDLCGWGNNELQVYTDKNHELKDGKLYITAEKKDNRYTSTRLNTKGKFSVKYGTIEIRAQLPRGKGLWPAFWMLGTDIDQVGWPACGEIDILEYVGREPGEIFTTLHTPSGHGNTANTRKTRLEGIENGFHDYRVTWTPNEISFSVDGSLVYTYAPQVKNKDTWPFDQPFYLLLNLAVGGNFGGHDVDDTALPASYIIEHIKVWSINQER